MPVLRPLIGMDKDEITAEAQRLGTYPDLDHPGSGLLHAVHAAASGDRARRGDVEAAEAALADRRDRQAGGRRGSRGGVRLPVIKCPV